MYTTTSEMLQRKAGKGLDMQWAMFEESCNRHDGTWQLPPEKDVFKESRDSLYKELNNTFNH
jgi:hypothetical protein